MTVFNRERPATSGNECPDHRPSLQVRVLCAGVTELVFGEPEPITPARFKKNSRCQDPEPSDKSKNLFADWRESLACERTHRGCLLSFATKREESFFGLGLHFHSVNQTARRKTLRTNSDATADLGDSHAAVPFFVSTRGYGLLIDTARSATFTMGQTGHLDPNESDQTRDSEEALYGEARSTSLGDVEIEVPRCEGLRLFFFEGPSMREAVARYNRFSGGGALPPLWGLGVWYRGHLDWAQSDALDMAGELRERAIPCDVLGLEPGWQTTSYSCSFTWNRTRFPDPRRLCKQLEDSGLKLNLWEHVFVHPSSPLHLPLAKSGSGSHPVWAGLVPDFTLEATREAFARHHETECIEAGVSGFKLDECDGSDFKKKPWIFPDHARFPGGADGEQMHQLLGLLYQHTLEEPFRARDRRTYGLVRASQAFAAPLPYVLYSDHYDHRDYVRALINAGFTGLLWTPEVRHAVSTSDYLRRLQTLILSPLAGINAWYIPMPPWKQLVREKNQAGETDPAWEQLEAATREVLKLRMRLIPYLYTAFARYAFEGLPPIRGLMLDYPEDRRTHEVEDAFLVGDSLLAAPLFAGENEREVYLPAGGVWFDFWTGAPLAGGRTHRVAKPDEQIPLFVKENTILPLARPLQSLSLGDPLVLEPRLFGDAPAVCRLYRDDGHSFAYEGGEYGWQSLAWEPEERRFTSVWEGPDTLQPYAVAEHKSDPITT